MNYMSTVRGSLLEGFYPAGWDMGKIDRCCSNRPGDVCRRQKFWNRGFEPVPCNDLVEFEVKMGHEIASEICNAKARGQKIAFILPVGPMGMYKWAVYFLREWKVSCEHVWCFNMDEWADGIAKINIHTDLCLAGMKAMRESCAAIDPAKPATGDYLKTHAARVAAMKETVYHKMELFGSVGKA